MELGPIDIVVIGYPAGRADDGRSGALLMDLVERGIIRVLDVLFVTKNEDGTFSGFDAQDLDRKSVGDFTVFEGASSGLLGDEDAEKAAEAIEPGSGAVMIVYENRWAAPFVAAVRRNGGEAIAYQRIPTQDLIDALDAVEASVLTERTIHARTASRDGPHCGCRGHRDRRIEPSEPSPGATLGRGRTTVRAAAVRRAGDGSRPPPRAEPIEKLKQLADLKQPGGADRRGVRRAEGKAARLTEESRLMG